MTETMILVLQVLILVANCGSWWLAWTINRHARGTARAIIDTQALVAAYQRDIDFLNERIDGLEHANENARRT